MSQAPQRLVNTLRGWIVRYYVAVQLSAAALSPDIGSVDQVHDPAPIIRPYMYRADTEWDAGELVLVREQVGVLTVPVDRARPEYMQAIGNN